MISTLEYVPLIRRFVEFNETDGAEEALAEGLDPSLFGEGVGWSELVAQRLVVVLGEEGTGKSTEFEEQARRLCAEGRQAFFVPLEDLADQQVSLEDELALADWRKGVDEGLFFLDSVDEARLVHPSAFRRALKTLVRLLGSAARRASVVVSCRVSDWQYRADEKTIAAELLPLWAAPQSETAKNGVVPQEADAPSSSSGLMATSTEDQTKPEIKVYRLARLDQKRIAQLAQAWGVANVDEFMGALLDADLQIFAGRPRDLEWLVGYWQEHEAFGSLTEMVEENVHHKLVDRNPTHGQLGTALSAVRCREGVEALAAACVLCERPLIALPDPEFERERPPRSFEPAEVLTGWTTGEIRALLTRGIFDPATYGRARFHDPMVRDYLAACWMAERLKAGHPLFKVRGLVLGTEFGKLRPVPSKRTVLGWLATMSPDIRRDAVYAAPDVVLYCGDVSRIPIEDREQALKNLAARLEQIGWTEWTVFDSDVRRIADPALGPTVHELLATEIDNRELSSLLLRIVRFAPMPGCAQAALGIATNSKRDDGVRTHAARAVVAAGTDAQRTMLLEYAKTASGLSNRLLGGLSTALFPEAVNVDDCLAIARRTAVESTDSTAGIGQHFQYDTVDSCPPGSLGELLSGLLEMASTAPMIELDGREVVSEKFAWTVSPIVNLLQRILKEIDESQLDTTLIAKACLLLDGCRHYPDIHLIGRDDLRKDLSGKPAARRSIYWAIVRHRLSRRADGHFAWHIQDELVVLDRNDLDWLLNDIGQLRDKAEVAAAGRTAIDIWFIAGRPEELVRPIAEVVERSSGATEDLKKYVRNNLYPQPEEEPEWKRRNRERRSAREADEQAALAKIRAELSKRVEAIRAGTDIGGLVQCRNLMQRGDGGNGSSWAQTNIHTVAAELGEEIAEAAREGFKVSWKNWIPPLPCEREDKQQVEYGVLVGLSGLALLAAEGNDLGRLSPDEAEAATHYALRELNGFPDWLTIVAEEHADIIRNLLARQLDSEFSTPDDSNIRHEVLSKLRYGSAQISALCSDTIINSLAREEPANRNVLSDALEVVLAAGERTMVRLGDLAAERAQKHANTGNEERLVLWLQAWLQVDGMAAIQFLEELIESRREIPSSVVQKLATSFGDRAWGARDSGHSDYLRPNVLERLIPLVYSHVRPEDDPKYEGVHDIGPREHAQDFRNQLPQVLANQMGADAQRVLRKLATTLYPLAARRWMSKLADQQAAMAVEYPPWLARDVANFTAGHETEPKTGEELFEIALDRVLDIKDDIEHGDFSDRGLFQGGMPEKTIQKWLAGRLRRESRDRYSVSREEEIDQSYEIDIRLHNPNAGYVTVEIKPVETGTSRYSFSQLIDALREQLVGQYMSAAESRHGILIVAMLEKRRWRSSDGAGSIGFSEVIDRLNAVASEIANEDPNVDNLSVVGMDFDST